MGFLCSICDFCGFFVFFEVFCEQMYHFVIPLNLNF